jgi:hypothetical protein
MMGLRSSVEVRMVSSMYALYYREQHGLLVTGEQLALDEINKLGKPRFGMLWNYIYMYIYICVFCERSCCSVSSTRSLCC